MTRRNSRPAGLALVVALTLSACAASDADPVASPTPTPQGTVQPQASAPPTEWVEPVVEPPPGMLPPGSVAVVTADALRIRGGRPGTPEFDQGPMILGTGDLVTVGWSPFSYLAPEDSPDGRGWYEVGVGGRVVSGGEFYGGWVAAGDAGLEWLEPAPVVCPASVSLEVLLWTPARDGEPEGRTTAWDRLACVGNRSIALEGVFETCYEGGHYPYVFEPAYLAVPDNCAALMLDDIDASGHSRRAGSVALGIPPAVAAVAPVRGDVIRITGHFDDPASSTCTSAPAGDFTGTVDTAFLALFCRERLVVEEIEVIGHRELAPLP